MTDRASRIEIRPATPADRGFIEDGVRLTFDAHAALNPQYFNDKRRAVFMRNVGRGLKDLKGPRYLVASTDGNPVGYVSIIGLGPARVVQDIFVSPGMRRGGVAGTILDHVERTLQSDRAAFIHATVWDGNDASHALFASRGFVKRPGLLPRSIAALFPALRATDYVLNFR